jgi:hypothetical protein
MARSTNKAADLLILPEFSLLNRQPKVPHVARIIARRDVGNDYGTLITYTVRRSRNGKDWWIDAVLEGMRMSDTLHTSVRAKADAWVRAVETGRVRVGERKIKAQVEGPVKNPAQLEREIRVAVTGAGGRPDIDLG